MARIKSAKFPLLVLRLQFEAPKGPDGFGHIKGWLARTDDRMLYRSDESVGGKYAGVRITSQTDYVSLVPVENHGAFGPMYAVGLEWERSEGRGLRELRYGVEALSDLERKMDKMQEKFGPPSSMGAWVQRVCTAIGITNVKVPYVDYFMSPADAASRIDSAIYNWQTAARALRGVDAA